MPKQSEHFYTLMVHSLKTGSFFKKSYFTERKYFYGQPL